MKEKLREEQIEFLQKIKPVLISSSLPELKIRSQESMNVAQEADNLDELVQRIEKIEKFLEIGEDDGVRKTKIKEQIISLLQQNKKLTSSQLSKLIGLSRTRCSEYFRELTREGTTEGVIINRQKYYKIVGK
jgi:Fic family protein